MNYVCADIHGRWDKYQAMLEDLNLGRMINSISLGM